MIRYFYTQWTTQPDERQAHMIIICGFDGFWHGTQRPDVIVVSGTAIIIFVDVVLGPGLTLLVFKPGKPKLKFDMTLILVFQLVALVWGVKSVYEDRPAVTVFHDGRFFCMTQTVSKDVDVESISQGKSGNQKMAYLAIPESFDERGEFMREAYLHNVSSEYYYGSKFEPINENNINEILEYELSLSEVKEKSRKHRYAEQLY